MNKAHLVLKIEWVNARINKQLENENIIEKQ
jgi:hypothetical protein